MYFRLAALSACGKDFPGIQQILGIEESPDSQHLFLVFVGEHKRDDLPLLSTDTVFAGE